MAGSVEDLGAPESWEVADLDESMNRLMLSSKKDEENKAQELDGGSSSDSLASAAIGKAPEDAFNQVDQFLREALQNPRERLSVLRLEQDVEKFIRDPCQQQFDFQQLPTSYLRLAAHRVAQHYFLQSMVLLDSNSLDGSGSRIIVRKTSETRFPMIRLADIPVNLPSEESSVVKVSIKQRPHKHSQNAGGMGQKSLKSGGPKSVEERKEEYNRARARIFNNTNSSSSGASVRSDNEARLQDNGQDYSLGISNMMEGKSVTGAVDANPSRVTIDSTPGSSRSARSRTEKEQPSGRNKQNSRVAIFRDRDSDRSDPDYDRNYDRYTRRFDPGFGFSGGPYAIQPTFTPALNYNTEFPQLRPPTHRPQISIENQSLHLPQHLSGLWGAPSSNPGIGYGHHPEGLMTPFSPNHAGARAVSAAHLQPSHHYSVQRPGLPFIHPHEHVHSIFSQPHQQQHDASSELGRPW